jgi:hypothetical protein
MIDDAIYPRLLMRIEGIPKPGDPNLRIPKFKRFPSTKEIHSLIFFSCNRSRFQREQNKILRVAA